MHAVFHYAYLRHRPKGYRKKTEELEVQTAMLFHNAGTLEGYFRNQGLKWAYKGTSRDSQTFILNTVLPINLFTR